MGSNGGSGDFLAGFFVGALVGAVAALLFAPARGDEVRSQLAQKGIELRDRAEVLSEEASKRAEDLRARGLTALEAQKVRIQEAIDEGKRAAARKKEELIAQIETARSPGSSVDVTPG